MSVSLADLAAKLQSLERKIANIEARLDDKTRQLDEKVNNMATNTTNALVASNANNSALITKTTETAIKNVLAKELYPKLANMAQYIDYKTGDGSEIVTDFRMDVMGVRADDQRSSHMAQHFITGPPSSAIATSRAPAKPRGGPVVMAFNDDY